MGRKVAKRVKYLGKFFNFRELEKLVGVKKCTLYSRVKRGMTIEEAISPSRPKEKTIIYNDKEYTIRQFSRDFFIPDSTLERYIFIEKRSIDWALTHSKARLKIIEEGIESYHAVMRRYNTPKFRMALYRHCGNTYRELLTENLQNVA
jgi:hypothetical protein